MEYSPTNVAEALKKGYLIYYQNYEESRSCLQECEALGIRWMDGENALDYLPSRTKGCIGMDFYSGRLFARDLSPFRKTINYTDIMDRSSLGHPPFRY